MLGQLLRPEIQEIIKNRDWKTLRRVLCYWEPVDIAGLLEELPAEEDVVIFRLLPRELAADTFEYLSTEKQQDLIRALATQKEYLASILNELSPDDRTALLEELPAPVTQRLLNLLSPEERRVAVQLLGYPEDSVGRLMTPDYVAVRPDWTVREALDHIRRYGKDSETLNVIYVVDEAWRLVDDLHIREVLLADPEARVAGLMHGRVIALKAADDQETAVKLFRDWDRIALPVTDSKGVLLGIVTIDDVLDVAEEEATEDIQKLGAVEALEEPYLTTSLATLVQKRAKWLVVLFFGELLTATAMAHFEGEIERAVVLAVFLPLIISTGGNSGSQAATLIIRAMAIGEIGLADWWRVMRREVLSGLLLGGMLGAIGLLRVMAWDWVFGSYGEHAFLIGLTVGISLVGIVLWGTLSGSMLPFILRRMGADPAASSTPFVATLVDVTGVILYFTVAALLLTGRLL